MSMVKEILIAGFGGQGIMLMGHLLAYGAIYEGLEVTFFPSYGPEMRGGTANCTVVISDRRIGSPIRNTFTAVMAMNKASLEKFENRVNAGGVLIYNETLIDTPPARQDIMTIAIPANKIATDLGNPQVANMVAVGGLVIAEGIISLNSLAKGLRRELPKHRHNLIPLNERAIKRGMDVVQKSIKGKRC
jgi:2-oxoglutarate ferredoxin oxidoreductase subunit gamma